MIPRETVDKILDATRIVEVVGDFLPLKKRGANYIACCPFHNEKTPSFYVSPSKGIYKCFGCGKVGTAVGFVMEHESLNYSEALKYLARKYHIEVHEEEETAEDVARRFKYESLYLVSEFAGKFFQESLATEEGSAIGMAYFKSRGLEDETIHKYGLGWAPVSRTALLDAARSAGYKEEYLVDAGLCSRYDDGKIVDRFFDRVMFPIHSPSGRIIAFGGRTLRTDKKVAKYVNSPETEIYVKSRSLYGIYFARNEISRQDRCILVEGYLDVLSMHQLGLTNVVASSGTSLTQDQVRLIKKYTDNVTIIYDGDSAGIHAAVRGIGLVLKEGMNVKVVLLPDGQDPDDFAKAHTLDQVKEYISANERDFIEFKTDLLLQEAGNDPLKKANLINDIADTTAQLPDAVLRPMYVRSCAERFSIEEGLLSARVGKTRTSMIVEEKKRLDREQRVEEAIASSSQVEGNDGPEAVSDSPYVLENPFLAPCEKEILGFVLEYGCSQMEFDKDSEYYEEGHIPLVADFIDAVLADDGIEFVNTLYRKTYEAYFSYFGEGLSQTQIQGRLLNNDDPDIVAVSSDILVEKYRITVESFEKSLTNISTILLVYIPKTLQAYQCKRVEIMIRELTESLSAETDAHKQAEIIRKIGGLNKVRTHLNNMLGRV